MTGDRRVRIEPDAISVDGRRYDPAALDFIARITDEFGPEVNGFVFPGWNPERKVHVLADGVVILDAAGLVASLFFCFDPVDGNPYSHRLIDVPVFPGTVSIGALTFAAGQSESFVHRIPSISGHGGAKSFREGPVHVGLNLKKKKKRNRLGRRSGSAQLVWVSVEWPPARPV